MSNEWRGAKASNNLEQYIKSVCNDQLGKVPKYENGWDAAFLLRCLPIDIGNSNFTQMRCALNQCPNCVDKWKDLVSELELNCSEQISYVVFGTLSKCSYHGDMDIRIEGKEYICRACKNMWDAKKIKLKRGTPKVKQVRLRIMLSEAMSDFMKPGGTYGTYLWKMFFHATHTRLLGSRFCMKMIYDYAATNNGIIVCKMDYSERYQPLPDVWDSIRKFREGQQCFDGDTNRH